MTSKYYYLITWQSKRFDSVNGYIFKEDEIIEIKDEDEINEDYLYDKYDCTIRCCREEIYICMCDAKDGKSQICTDGWYGFKIIPVTKGKPSERKLQKYIDLAIEYNV